MSELEEGRRLRDEGMARVDANSHPAWRACADQTILDLAKSGREFAADDVTAVCGQPAHPNATGARFSAASRRGIIEPVGYRQAVRKERHASRMLTWRGTAKAGATPATLTAKPAPNPIQDERTWKCTICQAEVHAGYVQQTISKGFGTGPCPRCHKSRTVALR